MVTSQGTLIKRFRLNRAALKEIPRAELELFLALGHLHNELSLLQRLVVWSFSGQEKAPEPHLQAQITQSMIFVRYLGARLFEGWQTLQKEFFGRKISKAYESELAGVARQAYEEVKDYNSRKNPLKALRNGFAFHSSGGDIGRGLEHLSDETLDMYLGKSATESLFYASEMVSTIAILGTAKAADRVSGFDRLVGEIVSQAGHWILLLQGLIDVFLRLYPSAQEKMVEEFELQGLASFDMIQIPWFTRPPDSGVASVPNPAPATGG